MDSMVSTYVFQIDKEYDYTHTYIHTGNTYVCVVQCSWLGNSLSVTLPSFDAMHVAIAAVSHIIYVDKETTSVYKI